METMTLHKVELKNRDDSVKKPAVYCLIRSNDSTHCSKSV